MSEHNAALVIRAIDRLAPRWTTWALQTITQHGQMTPTKLTAALPWLTAANSNHILRRMHTNGLLDRPDFGVYEVSCSGQHARSVHRTLASWHRTHSRAGGLAVAEAERTEDTLRRLRGDGAVDLLNTLSQHGPLQHGVLHKASGLASSSFYNRLHQLQQDQLLTRTGPSFRAAYTLTLAAQALGPVFAELAAFESTAPSFVVQHKPTLAASTARASAAVRRTHTAVPGLFSHAPAPQPHVPAHVAARSHPSRTR
ncbi:hypothetical protein [Streptomyces sioyaensis]|uniref:hypothetical protein n=1 Tax=Streptomyces sioyaensis TaxID=67364 RepID=UPI00371FCF6F